MNSEFLCEMGPELETRLGVGGFPSAGSIAPHVTPGLGGRVAVSQTVGQSVSCEAGDSRSFQAFSEAFMTREKTSGVGEVRFKSQPLHSLLGSPREGARDLWISASSSIGLASVH